MWVGYGQTEEEVSASVNDPGVPGHAEHTHSGTGGWNNSVTVVTWSKCFLSKCNWWPTPNFFRSAEYKNGIRWPSYTQHLTERLIRKVDITDRYDGWVLWRPSIVNHGVWHGNENQWNSLRLRCWFSHELLYWRRLAVLAEFNLQQKN